ncbi:transport and Golgi organization protein 2 [Tribolium castaneum]|uniref:Transport and Golgi organization protein 2-like Protein n=1 Tax=Tribolium castaneum TaxID=7070 RepID=D2A5G9_TRICA|nr:PREDICTED: transport and Golgi organization protein 2 [Tribolium castaneum]EFA05078.1 Transport and Golgi organization protein 2-like Protein [Tribolium castaneum]|eukprot:XP_967518.1 PREDICTED: transport and Golgi organization protein 2 [Tribolium castaneum]
MCILFVYTDPTPPKGGYRLIVASNRDEYYKRPARQAFKCPHTNIIGGRDMEPGREGGMWLGVSLKPQMIKFGALLNVTGAPKREAQAGRGPLVYNYLAGGEPAPEYITKLVPEQYSAFNLFMVEVSNEITCYHHSNSPEDTLTYTGRQVLAFGNSTPQSPFTKVKKGGQKFEEIITNYGGSRARLVQELINLLKCEELHLPDPELEARAPFGVGFLSSIYVRMEEGGYGTRTHSVILVDDGGNVEFVEHTMKEPINPKEPQWDVTTIKAKF